MIEVLVTFAVVVAVCGLVADPRLLMAATGMVLVVVVLLGFVWLVFTLPGLVLIAIPLGIFLGIVGKSVRAGYREGS
jgi:hypothetical protein